MLLSLIWYVNRILSCVNKHVVSTVDDLNDVQCVCTEVFKCIFRSYSKLRKEKLGKPLPRNEGHHTCQYHVH